MDGQIALQRAYRERAERLAAREGFTGKTQNVRRILAFRLGVERYAFDLECIAEVIPYTQSSWIPGAPPHIAGVIDVRGELRPVLNLRYVLGIPALDKPNPAALLLLYLGSSRVAVQTDGVDGVQSVTEAELQAPAAGAARYVCGTAAGLLMVLDRKALADEYSKEFQS
jgi:Chemotaxis signal transduction protein